MKSWQTGSFRQYNIIHNYTIGVFNFMFRCADHSKYRESDSKITADELLSRYCDVIHKAVHEVLHNVRRKRVDR